MDQCEVRGDRARANDAVMTYLAEQLDLPWPSFRLISGNAARRKTILIQGASDDIVRRLAALSP
jgi:uncharacterized protein YggU (UPF0235/DUF167 family)